MDITDVKSYLNSKCFKPYFKYVDNENYLSLISAIKEIGNFSVIRISDCCSGDDKKPDLDALRAKLREIDVDFGSNQCILIGLAEYLALEGIEKARKTIQELVSFNLGTARCIVVCRGFKNELNEILNSDIRMKRQISVDFEGVNTFSLSLSPLGIGDYHGLKAMLRAIEDNDKSQYAASTIFEFPKATIQIEYVKNYKEVLFSHFVIETRNASNEDYWRLLWNDLQEKRKFENLFLKYNFSLILDEDFYKRISTDNYENWLYFEYLKRNLNSISNSYLKKVLSRVDDGAALKKEILYYILEVPHENEKYEVFYNERKKLIKYYNEQELAVFVNENRQNIDDSIYHLTDVSKVERQEIIAYIGQHGIPARLDRIYPQLSEYLQKYYFSDTSIKELLTDYFDKYKELKLTNIITPDFQDLVNDYALKKIYNRLPSRNELIMDVDKSGAFLCWIDALGVEYLAYMVALAKRSGLKCTVKIGRADLPTLTSINKGFYDSWANDLKCKEERLDDLKHHDKGGYRYSPSNLYPIHLSDELDVIRDVFNDAATELSLRHCKRYVIASDHGASRLAVIAKKEEVYETDTKGEHSGRCCKAFNGYNLEYSTEDNGYVILSDYGRFKGSRAANVEVHGGASLEEVVVPLVILSLNDSNLEIKLAQKKVFADRKTGIEFVLYANGFIEGKLLVEYNGDKYHGIKTDDSHWKFSIGTIKKAGVYKINVFVDDDLASSLNIEVSGKMGSVNSDFDDLF